MDNKYISIENLTIKHSGKMVLDNINLDIAKGEFVAILGPNGSGKSTLLQAILGFIKPDSGDIKIGGVRVSRGNPKIGYSPQAKPFDTDIPITGRDYVELGLLDNSFNIFKKTKNKKQIVEKTLEDFDAKLLGDKKLGKMSGGEQQRISLAQALVSEPHLLLLDEPLANLDLSYQSEILQRLSKEHQEHRHTILLVAHDINPLLPFIDNVIYLANTHAQIGKPHEVITEEVLSNLYSLPVKVFDVDGRIFVAAFDGIIH